MCALLIIALNAAPMDQQMREYFDGERTESYVFIAAGLLGFAAGVPLVIDHGDVGRPMSVPLLVFGLVDLALGIGLWVRTPGQVRGLAEQLGRDPAAWREEEGKRMRGVMNGFAVYRAFELTVASAGAFMAGIGYAKGAPTVTGVGLGLLVEAVVLLTLDFFAEARGRKYSAVLADFMP